MSKLNAKTELIYSEITEMNSKMEKLKMGWGKVEQS